MKQNRRAERYFPWIAAAVFITVTSPRRFVWFLIGSAIVATMAAFGIPPVRWFVDHLPLIKAMKNRLTLVADVAIASLALALWAAKTSIKLSFEDESL